MAKVKACIIAFLCFAPVFCSAQQSDLTKLSEDRQNLMDTLTSYVGTQEKGHNAGKRVAKFLKSVGLGTGYPWCAAYANYGYQVNSLPTPEKGAWSPAWFPDSRTAYERGESEWYHPLPGDVFGIYFESKGRIAHLGVIYNWNSDKFVKTIEGNTNKAGSREGHGVYKKRRVKRQIYKVSVWANRDRRLSHAVPNQPGNIQCPFHNYLIQQTKRA